MTALLARRAIDWYLSARVQRLVWASIALNAAYLSLPPVRRALPEPMFLVTVLSRGTWLLGN